MDFIVGNYSLVTEFILLGFPICPELQIALFLLFLTLYSMILMGNIGLMMLIRFDLHLQTPVCFFLSNLSFVDLCYSSVFVPKILVNFLSQNKSISCHGRVQLFATPWTITCQALLSLELSRQEYWSGLPFLPPRNLAHPGMRPVALAYLALTGRFLTRAMPGKKCN